MSRLRPHALRWLLSLVLALPALAVSATAAAAQARAVAPVPAGALAPQRELGGSDLNGDGRGDLLWHHQATGELYVWLMNGTVAATGSYLSPDRVTDLGWQIRGLADFNADGKLDVLWHHQTTGDLYVWLMDGTSVSSGAYLTPSRGTDIGWQVKGVADLNGDAKPDLLWQNQSSGEFSVWLMNGLARSSTVATTPAAMTDPQWQVRGLADFNGDGQPDILWHHQGTGDLYVWFMSGTTATSGSYLTPSRFADTRWQIRSLNDVNGDGKADLLWHHQETGDLYVWLMNGTTVTAGSYLTPSRFANAAWQIVPRPPSGGGATCPVPRPLRAYEDGRPRWQYNSHPHTMGNVDSTPVVINQLEFCQAIGMGEMGGLPRASCPVRPDGHPDRVACEDYLREGPPTRDSRNGQDCTPNNTDNPAAFLNGTGNCRMCNPARTVCTVWY
jgi:hypothetical protein